MPYVDNNDDLTFNPTQLQRNEVTHHVTTTPDDISAPSNQRTAAPTQPSHHYNEPSHVANDVIALPANGVPAAPCSRSSSRSSGFDEISVAVTEWSLLPVSLQAHASNDRPKVTSSNMADDDHGQADMSGKDGIMKNENYGDGDSLDTLRFSVDNSNNANNNNNSPNGDKFQASCSGQSQALAEEKNEEEAKANDSEKLEELSRQIESMSERFNKLFARVKASECATELRRSTASLDDCDTRGVNHHQPANDDDALSLNQQPRSDDSVRQSRSNSTTEVTSKYSRNTAYRQWLSAKTGLGSGLDSGRDILVNKTASQQPITAAADDDVAEATVSHVVTAASAPIGRRAGDDVTAGENQATTKVDDVTKCATTVQKVTPEIHESQNDEASAADGINLSGLDTDHAGRINELCSDLQTPLKPPSMYHREPSVECLALECHVPLSSRSIDELSVGYDESGGKSGHPAQDWPRSMSAQPDEVFITQSLDRDGKIWCYPSEGEPGLATSQPHSLVRDWKRGHSSEDRPRSTAAQPDDVFSEDIVTTPTHALGRSGKLSHPFHSHQSSMPSQLGDGKSVSSAPRRLLPSPLMLAQSRSFFVLKNRF